MSGPTYPPGPQPGSNAIGFFQIGISPIGTIAPFDWWQTVISQYANSAILTQLISNFFQYIDPTQSLDAFFDFVLNVDTAQGEGLNIWGRIVGVTRVLNIASGDFFGMTGPTGASGDPYNVSPFFSGSSPLTNNYALTDSAFRTLIFAKALANISDGSIKSINQILINLFPGRGNAYVIDNEDMTLVYRFEFTPTPVELAIVGQSGVLPKPVGVLASISHA